MAIEREREIEILLLLLLLGEPNLLCESVNDDIGNMRAKYERVADSNHFWPIF